MPNLKKTETCKAQPFNLWIVFAEGTQQADFYNKKTGQPTMTYACKNIHRCHKIFDDFEKSNIVKHARIHDNQTNDVIKILK